MNAIIDSPAKLARLTQWVQKLDLAKPWRVEIEVYREARNNKQNARLWLLHTAAAEVTGYSPEEMHEFALCRHFGFNEVERKDLFTGEIIKTRIPLKRSSARDTKEFAEFMTTTEVWYGQEFGVWLE